MRPSNLDVTLSRLLPAAVLGAALSLACEPKPATEVIVELHAEPTLLSKATDLRVQVQTDDGKLVLDRVTAVDATQPKLARVPLIPKDEDATRRFRLTATLRDSTQAALSDVEVRGGYVEGELRELEVWLYDACEGKQCGPGRTCFQGTCLGSCFDVETKGPAKPTCGECQTCGDSCQNADGISCGCPGEVCGAGTCAPNQRFDHVSAGEVHTCASVEDGTTYCWGANAGVGLLGQGANAPDSASPIAVPGVSSRRGIATGVRYTCTITFGARKCWGENWEGQFGTDVGGIVPDPVSFDDPFDIESIVNGYRHTCGLTISNELYCWGYNEFGNLGLGNVQKSIKTPMLVPGSYVQVAANGDHTCGVAPGGDLYCWGRNSTTELGAPLGDPVPSPIEPGCESGNAPGVCFHDYRTVGAGYYHTCAIRESGEMVCFGGNKNGQLGIGTPNQAAEESDPQAVVSPEKWSDVSGGQSFTCALNDAGALFCWGRNEDRELGIPDVDFLPVPTRVPVDAPAGFRSVSAGARHACAIREDRTLWCWGKNSEGQIGVGAKTPLPVDHPTRICPPSAQAL